MFSVRTVLCTVLILFVLAPAALAQACTGSDVSTCNTAAGAPIICHNGQCYFGGGCSSGNGYTPYGNSVPFAGHYYYMCQNILTGSIYRRRRDLDTCPGNQERCPVLYGRGGTECIDVLSNVESCGGCVGLDSDDSGVDCTQIAGSAAVRCNNGQCVIDECDQGYKLDIKHSACTSLPGMRIQKDKS